MAPQPANVRKGRKKKAQVDDFDSIQLSYEVGLGRCSFYKTAAAVA